MADVSVSSFLSGAVMMAFLVIALFFAEYCRRTNDWFFAIFSFAFALLGIERIVMIAARISNESQSLIYIIRVVAFLAIVVAVLLKNRQTE